MSEQPAQPSPASSKATDSFGARFWSVICLFLPKPIQEAYKQGLLLTLVYVLLLVVAFPLIVAFLAAFWLSLGPGLERPWHQIHPSVIYQ